MRYDPLSRGTVKITLSEEELREFSLCSESISMRTVEAKQNLALLLKKMKLFSGCKAGRLFLEAFPRSDGGCVLYVSSLAGETPAAEENSVRRREIMCLVGSMELLIRLCAGLFRQCGRLRSWAYRRSGEYALVVSGGKQDADTVRRLMCEYGQVSADSMDVCSAREQGSLICENAVEKLSGLF